MFSINGSKNINKKIEDKKRIYKEFFPLLDKEYHLKVCDYISRLENEEEYQARKVLEANDKKGKNASNKNKNNPIINNR